MITFIAATDGSWLTPELVNQHFGVTEESGHCIQIEKSPAAARADAIKILLYNAEYLFSSYMDYRNKVHSAVLPAEFLQSAMNCQILKGQDIYSFDGISATPYAGTYDDYPPEIEIHLYYRKK